MLSVQPWLEMKCLVGLAGGAGESSGGQLSQREELLRVRASYSLLPNSPGDVTRFPQNGPWGVEQEHPQGCSSF